MNVKKLTYILLSYTRSRKTKKKTEWYGIVIWNGNFFISLSIYRQGDNENQINEWKSDLCIKENKEIHNQKKTDLIKYGSTTALESYRIENLLGEKKEIKSFSPSDDLLPLVRKENSW